MNTGAVLTLSCPTCGKTVKVKTDAMGKKVRCPGPDCDTVIAIPGAAKSGSGIKGQLMITVGVVFAMIAAILTIRELKLEPAWIVSMVLVGLVVISEFFKGLLKSAAVMFFALVGLATPALFFLTERRRDERELAFYIGAALFFGLSSYLVFRSYRIWSKFDLSNRAKLDINVESIMVWFALIFSSLAFSWVTYYRFLASFGEEEFIVRRLAFTLFFVVVGVVCTVLGRNSTVPFLAVTGLIYMAAGVIKALAYDIFKTEGMVRIGVFAGCGAVLLLGGLLMKGSGHPKAEAVSEFAAVIED